MCVSSPWMRTQGKGPRICQSPLPSTWGQQLHTYVIFPRRGFTDSLSFVQNQEIRSTRLYRYIEAAVVISVNRLHKNAACAQASRSHLFPRKPWFFKVNELDNLVGSLRNLQKVTNWRSWTLLTSFDSPSNKHANFMVAAMSNARESSWASTFGGGDTSQVFRLPSRLVSSGLNGELGESVQIP